MLAAVLNYIFCYFAVCPETEESLYTDKFFESQDLIVNALDNVEARRYMDRWGCHTFSYDKNKLYVAATVVKNVSLSWSPFDVVVERH